MRAFIGQSLLALVLLTIVISESRPMVLAAHPDVLRVAPPAVSDLPPVAVPAAAAPLTTDQGAAPTTAPAVAPLDLPLQPCRAEAHRAACDHAARELAAYGLDIANRSQWTLIALQRFVEAVEHLADAFGGGGLRAQRIACLTRALQTGPDGLRVTVLWQATPQERDGNPVRGGYAANTLFFNPNTLFLDVDAPSAVLDRAAAGIWWNFVHELAHLWDERSAPVAVNRQSGRMLRWVRVQQAAGLTDEYPSSYAVIGGPLEAFADSVAATVTGDAASRAYYGSLRDHFVQAALCEVSNCQP